MSSDSIILPRRQIFNVVITAIGNFFCRRPDVPVCCFQRTGGRLGSFSISHALAPRHDLGAFPIFAPFRSPSVSAAQSP